MISKRHVFFVAGFDPIDPFAHHARFVREYRKFLKIWALDGTVSEIVPAAGNNSLHWRVATAGAGWSTQTRFEPCDWQDIIQAEIGRSIFWQVASGIVTFLDLLVTGTAFRYFRAAWRYGVFFLVPFATLALFGVIAVWVGVGVFRLVPLGETAALIAGVLAGLAAFSGLMLWPARRWRTAQALADWNFARAYIYGRHPAIEARTDQLAARIADAVKAREVDEVLIVGHSLGATIAVDAIARALKQLGAIGNSVPVISLMTIGSTIPKITLHPAAGRWRETARQVAASPAVVWTEYQARRDPISFFKFDPVALRHHEVDRPGTSPRIHLVSIKDMLTPDTYYRLRWRFMRMHYQFVFANEARTPYDYFIVLCGPATLAELSAAPGGATDILAADGGLRSPAAPQNSVVR
jgi:pimeloyl-ACP methyl ester carboxylesterase